MCVYSKKCPCRTFLALLALLARDFCLSLRYGSQENRENNIPSDGTGKGRTGGRGNATELRFFPLVARNSLKIKSAQRADVIVLQLHLAQCADFEVCL